MRLPTYALFVLPDAITAVNLVSDEKIALPLSPETISYSEIIDAASYEKLVAENLATFFTTQGLCMVFLHESMGYVEVATKPMRDYLRQELLTLASYVPIPEDKLAFTGYTVVEDKVKVRHALFLSSTIILPISSMLKKMRCELGSVLPMSLLQIANDLKGAISDLTYTQEDSDDIVRYAYNVAYEIVVAPIDPIIAHKERRRYVILIGTAVFFLLTAILYALYAGGTFG